MKEKNKLSVKIITAGETAVGKTTITYLFREFLREKGFEVEQELSHDHTTVAEFDREAKLGLEDKIKGLTEKTKIVLSEVQTKRKSFKSTSQPYDEHSNL